ncbi:ISL3 family transposase [Actinocrispum wychmicini]|uniref:Transposase n=1 Tax=Actinocrispum wychmicini TaxID=1213861 RepID=A0A4R2J8T9_9PSEU|nr:ISL3 family transposase [Actinocrispum wychmicini]TCO55721.1 transposase [Actinocrispum wychmicini]
MVEKVERGQAGVRIWACAKASVSACSSCGVESGRVHSRHDRRVADVPVAGRPVVLWLRMRRFFCDNQTCPVRTLTEQIDGVISAHARRSPRLRGMLESIGLAMAARAGARLAGRLGLVTGRDTLLRLVRAVPDPSIGTVTVLGVDDFAFTRRRSYGTILLDMATHRPIDLLADRTADSLAEWLRAHPGVTIVCRDRAGTYAEGARLGAPDAQQVADRWHLWHGLAGYVERMIRQHRHDLRDPDHDIPESDSDLAAPVNVEQIAIAAEVDRVEAQAVVVRIREHYQEVRRLLVQGESISGISRSLRLDHKTVRRSARAVTVEELLIKQRDGRPGPLERFKPYLRERWNQGCTTATVLLAEIREQGYTGSYPALIRYLCLFRTVGAAPPATPAPPKVRDVTRWMLRYPDDPDSRERDRLNEVLARSSALARLAYHVASFAEMMTSLHGERLEEWITTVEADDFPHLHSFTAGLARDRAAVVNGLTMEHNSGAVEGAVSRLKSIKRSMYGRAKFDLLRKKVLCRV